MVLAGAFAGPAAASARVPTGWPKFDEDIYVNTCACVCACNRQFPKHILSCVLL